MLSQSVYFSVVSSFLLGKIICFDFLEIKKRCTVFHAMNGFLSLPPTPLLSRGEIVSSFIARIKGLSSTAHYVVVGSGVSTLKRPLT